MKFCNCPWCGRFMRLLFRKDSVSIWACCSKGAWIVHEFHR